MGQWKYDGLTELRERDLRKGEGEKRYEGASEGGGKVDDGPTRGLSYTFLSWWLVWLPRRTPH